jgi:hypothetical protein
MAEMYAEFPESTVLLRRHTLLFEGRCIDGFRWGVGGEGPAGCSCGERSPVLPSGAARKRWHRRHKAAISGVAADGGTDQ